MPQFTQWNVPDPFPNILYNPMAVDKAIADNQSTLGNLDINRQRLGIEQAKLDAIRAGNSVWADGDTTGTTGAGVGPLADAAPDQTRDAAGQASYNFWVGKGLAPHQAAGMAAQEVAESGGRPGVTGDGGDAIGLYQHHADRRALILANTGIDMTKPDANAQREGAYWELMNAEHGARQRLFASKDADEAGRAATEFERPDSTRRAIIDAERGRDARRIFQLANPNGAASVATASVDPRAGPRVGLAPPPSAAPTTPTVTSTAPTTPTVTPPGVNPNAGPRAGTVPPTTTTGQADDPNTAAVKQAATALLAMPEAEAAVAYGPTVRSLQAQGFAMNAPPTYPGHAALQSLVGGGDATTPDVAQTKTAMRLGGTDVAGPPGVVPTAAPAAPQPNVILDASGNPLQAPPAAPNRMMAGVGLPGVTIGLPQNGMAPPGAAVAPVTTAAAPTAAPAPAQGRPQVLQPPAAPSRAIDLAPTIQGGRFDGLTPNQANAVKSMALSLVPTQEIAARVETWRQQNLANKQAATSNLAAQQQADFARQQWLYEQQVKAGWEDAGGGVIRNKYTGETKYGGPPAPRSTKDEQGNTWLLEPGQPPKLMSANPSGVTGSGPDASALRTLNELAAKRNQGIPLTPQEEVNYSTAADVYQGMETIKNDVTKETVQVPKRPLPPGIPEPQGRGGAGAGGGPKVVLPGLSPDEQDIERNPRKAKVAESQYDLDNKENIRPIIEAGRQAQADQVRIKEMQDVLQRFSTGSGTEWRTAAANWIQRWAPAAVTGWEKESANLSGSNAAEAFSKLALVGAGTQERGVLGARGGYQAIKLFKDANPSVNLQDATNKSILDMQLITNQANQDYSQDALTHFTDNETKFSNTHKYESLNQFDRTWNSKRNPQVYAAAMGAISGQPYEQWSKGLQEPEIERALGVVSRAKPSAVVNGKSGPISMQPTSTSATPTPPAVGTVQDGFRFKGGNPASPTSWEPAT